jgi:hypothetical protein
MSGSTFTRPAFRRRLQWTAAKERVNFIGTEGDPEFSTRSHKTNASSQNVQQFVQHNVQRGPLMNLQVILFRCKIPGCDALRAAIEAPHPLHLHAMPDAWPGI